MHLFKVFIFCFIGLLFVSSKPPTISFIRVDLTGAAQGTTWHITYYGKDNAAPLSAGIFDDDPMVTMPDDVWEQRSFPRLFGPGLKRKARLNKAWYNYSVLKMIETRSADKLNKVLYWIDCGVDDFLTKGNCLLHIALTEKKVPREFRVRDGAHSWSYWRKSITDALQFIGQSFHQE